MSKTHYVVEYREKGKSEWQAYALWSERNFLDDVNTALKGLKSCEFRCFAVSGNDATPTFTYPRFITPDDLKMMESKPIIYDQEVE